MIDIKYYIWIILLIIYIISPRDLITPSLVDDLAAFIVMAYLLYQNRKKSKTAAHSDNSQYSQSGQSNQEEQKNEKREYKRADNHMTLSDAYKILEVSPETPSDVIKKAYREKIAKNHPDKVSHLSVELQEKARQLTVTINKAYELIKKERKF